MRETNTTKQGCFGYDKDKCKALKERYCDSGDCRFFKTKEEFEAGFKPDDIKAYCRKRNYG